jgi:hypothetical protein
MELDRLAVQGALRDVVALGANLHESRVILARQAAPPPREPYATVEAWTASKTLGRVEESQEDADGEDLPDGDIRRTTHRRVTCRVNLFGQGMVAAADRLVDRLEGEELRAHLAAAGVTYGGTPMGPRNLTDFLETGSREHAQLDLFLTLATDWVETVGHIERFGITGSAVRPDAGTIPLDATTETTD